VLADGALAGLSNDELGLQTVEIAVLDDYGLDVGVKSGFGQQQIGPYKFRLKQRLLQALASKPQTEPEKRRGETADNLVRP
jgi:hypothetical protein